MAGETLNFDCAYLQGVLAGEALAAEGARKRLNSQVDSLVALQIVIATKGLDALVALEGPFRLRLWGIVAVDHSVTTVALPNSHPRNH